MSDTRLLNASNSILQMSSKFWSHIQIGDRKTCWEWTAGRDKNGYGRTKIKKSHGWTSGQAHRVVYVLAKGAIPDGLCVLHTCDNPPCCNPDHLVLGTQVDNLQDMRKKGRSRGPSVQGENHWLTKVSSSGAEALRAECAAGVLPQTEIARKYGISRGYLWRINSGKRGF